MKIDNIEISGTVSEVYPEDKVDLVKKAKGGLLSTQFVLEIILAERRSY